MSNRIIKKEYENDEIVVIFCFNPGSMQQNVLKHYLEYMFQKRNLGLKLKMQLQKN